MRPFQYASDDTVMSPLWEWPVCYRLSLLSERRRRGLMQYDPEPIGDAEYS